MPVGTAERLSSQLAGCLGGGGRGHDESQQAHDTYMLLFVRYFWGLFRSFSDADSRKVVAAIEEEVSVGLLQRTDVLCHFGVPARFR